ncbi:hypothetical protein COB64_03740 [Candidatus Wolfebacteria bacterium]|nr:MAG: hypothetical protein COB64_03740 [Candidatus Wolfebacteria bacterium]
MRTKIKALVSVMAFIGFGSVSNTHAQAQKFNTPVIAPVKLNNLYVNVENPLKIAVAEIADSSLTVSISGCGTSSIEHVVDKWLAEDFETGNLVEVVESGYSVWVTEVGKATITVNYTYPDGTTRTSHQFFQCLNLQKPLASFMGIENEGEITKDNLKRAQGIYAKVLSQGFPYNWTVQSFSLTLVSYKKGSKHTQTLTSESNRLTPEMKELLEKVHQFDEIRIENIKAVGETSEHITLEPLYIQVM